MYRPNAFNVYTRRIWTLLDAGIPKLLSFCEFDILFVFANFCFFTLSSLVWSSLGNFCLNLRHLISSTCLLLLAITLHFLADAPAAAS